MKLIMLRHGETEENVAGTIQGQSRGMLTVNGRWQAKAAAARLRGEKIDLVFASDLIRARETLKAVTVYQPMVPVLFAMELRERAIGEYEGRPKDEYFAALKAGGASRLAFRPPGGESFADLHARTDRFLDRLLKNYRGKTVLLCTHGGPIRTLLASILKTPLAEMIDQAVANCSISTAEFDDDGEVRRCTLNSVSHLAAQAA